MNKTYLRLTNEDYDKGYKQGRKDLMGELCIVVVVFVLSINFWG